MSRFILARKESAIMDTASRTVLSIMDHGVVPRAAVTTGPGVIPPPSNAERVSVGDQLERLPDEPAWVIGPNGTAQYTHGGLALIRVLD